MKVRIQKKCDIVGDAMTIEEWESLVGSRTLISTDGMGDWAEEKGDYFMVMATPYNPFYISRRPDNATHVVWYNK